MTIDPQIVSDLNGIVVRGRPAWKWTAKMNLKGLSEVYGRFGDCSPIRSGRILFSETSATSFAF